MAMQVASLDGDEITELNREQHATAMLTTSSASRDRGQHDGGQVLDGIGLVLDAIKIVLERIVLMLPAATALFAFVAIVLATHGYMYLVGITVVVFLYLGAQALWNFCQMLGGGTHASFLNSPVCVGGAHATSLDFLRGQAQSRPWSDIQPELLGLVLGSLPSLADRVRLRAVCSSWRSNSLLQPVPLPFPWLSLPDGTLLSIPGGKIHRMRVPVGARCHGSIDNWLFPVSSDGSCSLMNPFSKIPLELQLPDLLAVLQLEIERQNHSYPVQPVYKLAVPSPPGLITNCPVVVLVMEDGDWVTPRTLCICQPHVVTCSFSGYEDPLLHLLDVAFLEGKLYALCWSGKLFILELDNAGLANPNIECIIDTWGDECVLPEWLTTKTQYTIRNYLTECGGRLLMVRRFMYGFHRWTEQFDVLEADLHANPRRWRRVSELGGHALFLGKHGSKSLPARECSAYQGDCIYFVYDWPCYSLNPLCNSGVFNMRNGMIAPLLSQAAVVTLLRLRHIGRSQRWCSTWFFPPGTA